MDELILRTPGARRIPEVQKVYARNFDESVLREIRREGGVGHFNDKNGRWVKSVLPFYDPVQKRKRVAVYRNKKESKPNPSMLNHENRDALESIMEREVSGLHPNVKPSEAKRAKKRLDTWVEGDRPVQGVDV